MRRAALRAVSGNGYEAKSSKQSQDFSGEALDVIEFNSMLCVCVLTWCVFRTARLVMQSCENILPTSSGCNQQVASRWTQLQRKITVSMLINSRLWGREAKSVLASLHQNSTEHLLAPEQWMSLFQRVRAQGIQSTLPIGDEADDPDFLEKKVGRLEALQPGAEASVRSVSPGVEEAAGPSARAGTQT